MAHRLSPEAEAELDAIWWYLAEQSGSVEIAGKVVASITDGLHLLSTYPEIGRRRDDLRPGLRSYPVEGYVILYRIDGSDVLILHILHGRRDIGGLLRGSR